MREQLVVALLGWEVVWWSLVCGRLEKTQGAILQPLYHLASWVQERDWIEDREFDPRRAFRETEAYQEKEAFLQELVSSRSL